MNPLKVSSFLAPCVIQEEDRDWYRKFFKYFPSGFSTELKKDINNVFSQYGFNFFVCRDRNDKQKAHCIHCKHYVVLPEKSRHNDKYVCPYCGIEGKIKHSWRSSYLLKNTMYMQYYEKADYDKKSFICRGLFITRWICLETLQVKYDIDVHAYYLFQRNNCKMVRYYGETWYSYPWVFEKKSIHPLWNNCYAEILDDNIGSFKRAVRGTDWEHCCYEELLPYLDDDFIRLLEFYDKYPQMEYIVKAGFASIIAKKIRKQSMNIGGPLLNLKAVDIRKSLKLPGLSKKDKKFIKSYDGDVTPEQLKLWQILKSENPNNDLTINYFKRPFISRVFETSGWMISAITDIHKVLPNLKKIVAYVYKQLEQYGTNAGITEYGILRDWQDYLAECKFLDLNLKDTAILLPKNLQVAHRNTSQQVIAKKDELLQRKMATLTLERQRYKYSFKNIVSMPAASVDELIAEGAALNHCVGTYADRYAKGETDIVFIRKVSEPDRSFYTMEIKNNQVVQVRGSHNCGMTDEVKEFVEHFKNDVLNKPKKISKKKGSKAA